MSESEQQEVKLNLYQKLVEVRKSIDGFTKDKKSFNYEYVSGTQVLSKIKSKMDELGLLFFPSITTQTHEIYPYKDKYGKEKIDFLVYGDMSYQWINADNPSEKLDIPWKYTGQQDDISKAFGSGLTYSERYVLLKFFGVPTDADDPDAKQPPKQQNKSGQQYSQPQNKPQQNNNNTSSGISDGQVKAVQTNISILIKEAKVNEEYVLNRLKDEFKLNALTSVNQLTKSQASQSITLLKKWTESAKSKQQQGG